MNTSIGYFGFQYNSPKYPSDIYSSLKRSFDLDRPCCEEKILEPVSKEKTFEEPMATQSITQRIKDTSQQDFLDGAWRAAAEVATASVRDTFLKTVFKKTSYFATAKAMLETEEGTAVLSYILGILLSVTPESFSNPKLTRLAKELRTAGISFFMSSFAKQILAPIFKSIDSLPDVEESQT